MRNSSLGLFCTRLRDRTGGGSRVRLGSDPKSFRVERGCLKGTTRYISGFPPWGTSGVACVPSTVQIHHSGHVGLDRTVFETAPGSGCPFWTTKWRERC